MIDEKNKENKNIDEKSAKKKAHTGSFFGRANAVKLICATAVLVVLSVIGLVFFARPTVSEFEKRELTKFPKLTWDSLMSGEFTSQVSTWYADTFPTREGMVNTNFFLQSLYGLRGESVNAGGTGDDIPDGPMDVNKPTDDGHGNYDNETGLYVNGDTAYELYHFSEGNSTRYVQLINSAAQKIGDSATVYDMIVPLNYTFALQDAGKSYGASDCRESIRYMYSGLDKNVIAVDICPVLSAHNNEYTYFRTDHHWTALGAYYAYTSFCESKKITPTPLESYQKLEFDGFLGTLYAEAKQPQAMKNNPDKVEAFVPMGTNKITVTEKNGNIVEYSIVNKATQSWYPAANAKYNCFIAGDNPYSEIHNPSKTDGSSVVVVKESFGNAFVPFLVDSYEYVYVVDYRYYDGNLIDLVKSKGIDDVIFINNVIATSTSSRLNELEDIIK